MKGGIILNYGFKPTTHGEALIAACMDLGAPLKITRAAVGSGLAGGSLANTHALVHYIADADIGERRHEGNRLFLSVQYRNDAHPEIEDFVLSEFIVYAQDPKTGTDTDLLYGTLGDGRQPVPAFRNGFPASVWTYPVILTVSGDLQVNVTASPGLVTFIDLQEAIDRLETEFDQKLEALKKQLIYRIANDIWKHNTDDDSHFNFLIADAALSPPYIGLPVPEDAQDILDDYIDVSNWWKTQGT